MAIRRPTQTAVRRQAVFEGFGDRERAAVDLRDFQQEATDRPHLYRIMYNPPRQQVDIEMCHVLSWWLCQRYSGIRKG